MTQSEAEITPVDKSAEPPIRDEIRGLRGSIDGMQRSIGPLFDALAERLLHRLSVDREEDRKRTDALLRHDALSARVTAVENALGEKDAVDVVLQDDVADVQRLAKRNEAEMRVFTRGRLGFGFASAALLLAGESRITWGGVKAWAWSHGLLLTVVVAVLVAAVGVELHTRARAQKGPPP